MRIVYCQLGFTARLLILFYLIFQLIFYCFLHALTIVSIGTSAQPHILYSIIMLLRLFSAP